MTIGVGRDLLAHGNRKRPYGSTASLDSDLAVSASWPSWRAAEGASHLLFGEGPFSACRQVALGRVVAGKEQRAEGVALLVSWGRTRGKQKTNAWETKRSNIIKRCQQLKRRNRHVTTSSSPKPRTNLAQRIEHILQSAWVFLDCDWTH